MAVVSYATITSILIIVGIVVAALVALAAVGIIAFIVAKSIMKNKKKEEQIKNENKDLID